MRSNHKLWGAEHVLGDLGRPYMPPRVFSKREGEGDFMRRGVEAKPRGPRGRDRAVGLGVETRQQVSGTGGGEEVDSALEPPEEASPADTLVLARQNGFQTAGFSNCEGISFCCWKPPS